MRGSIPLRGTQACIFNGTQNEQKPLQHTVVAVFYFFFHLLIPASSRVFYKTVQDFHTKENQTTSAMKLPG
jgi:hypothetical protein